VGHVLSSVAFGMIGIAAGLAVGRLEAFEGGSRRARGLAAAGVRVGLSGLGALAGDTEPAALACTRPRRR
jgi:hypothetical protein